MSIAKDTLEAEVANDKSRDFRPWLLLAQTIHDEDSGSHVYHAQPLDEWWSNHIEESFLSWMIDVFHCLGYAMPRGRKGDMPILKPLDLVLDYSNIEIMDRLMRLYRKAAQFGSVDRHSAPVGYAEFLDIYLDDLANGTLTNNAAMSAVCDISHWILDDIDMLKALKPEADALAKLLGFERVQPAKLHQAEQLILKRFGDVRKNPPPMGGMEI